jgi:hypothetical protein
VVPERFRYASWVLAARRAATRRAAGLPVWRAELAGLPNDVVYEVLALKPQRPRYRSTRLDRTGPPLLIRVELPRHVHGFGRVMAAIARHAGCKPATLYLWVEQLLAAAGKQGQPAAGRRAKRKLSE